MAPTIPNARDRADHLPHTLRAMDDTCARRPRGGDARISSRLLAGKLWLIHIYICNALLSGIGRTLEASRPLAPDRFDQCHEDSWSAIFPLPRQATMRTCGTAKRIGVARDSRTSRVGSHRVDARGFTRGTALVERAKCKSKWRASASVGCRGSARSATFRSHVSGEPLLNHPWRRVRRASVASSSSRRWPTNFSGGSQAPPPVGFC